MFGAIVAAIILLFFSLAWSFVHNKTSGYPPSPPADSILGHQVMGKNSLLRIGTWIEQYGPLISLRVGIYHYVVIGRHKAAMDIMEKQGSLLADRPRWVAGELLARGFRILLTPAGERLKRMRRALHTHLQPKAAQTYDLLQTMHGKSMIRAMMESPEQYFNHARTYGATVIVKLTYGKNTPTHASDPIMLQIHNFPWLKYIPWYGRELRQGFVEDHALFHHQLDTVKQQMNHPDSGPSFAKFLLERGIDFGLNETESAFLAGSMFSAGVESTARAICIAITAAARYPDAQAVVHAELDAVIGSDRLPTFDDEASLPTLCAFILESMRWRPITPRGIAHRATEDITWGDYHIPAGTTVIGNHWAISRDPEVFPNPDKFDLTRWLTADGSLRTDLKFPYFGFGRRACPGQHVATRSIFISTALILWSYHLSIDESKPIDDMKFMEAIIRDVPPVALRFEPRMEKETLKMMMEDSRG